MHLLHAILSNTRLRTHNRHEEGKLLSPPPEVDLSFVKKKKRDYKNAHVQSRVDTKPPIYNDKTRFDKLQQWSSDHRQIYKQNMSLIMGIKKIFYEGGRVDSHWREQLPRTKQYYQNRVNRYKWIYKHNIALYRRLEKTKARLPTTEELNTEWKKNREKIIRQAHCSFVLFDPKHTILCEDRAFDPPPGVKRPRVYLKLGRRGYSPLGDICIELFTDICPVTCGLFLELLCGYAGYTYIGTCFFRKVPHLFWSGGDVIYNNGIGCYMQLNRVVPIGAENFHFSHSMPGLLSMRVTKYNEVCGIFNITFKPLPQFDLKNIVFGRVIRPCAVYNAITQIGNALGTQPVIEILSAKMKCDKMGPKNNVINR